MLNDKSSDNEKWQRYWEINNRYFDLLRDRVPGRASEALISAFKSVLRDYENFARSGIPKFIDAKEVYRRIATAKRDIAFVYSILGDIKQSKNYYGQAASDLDTLGENESAKSCRDNILTQNFREAGNIDEEVKRILTSLRKTPAHSLQYVGLLVELAELYLCAGDDFAAKDHFAEAESELRNMGYNPPTEAEVSVAFHDTMNDISSGKYNSGPSKYATISQLQSIYSSIFRGLAHVYRDDREKSKAYLEKARQIVADDPSEEGNLKILLSKLYAKSDAEVKALLEEADKALEEAGKPNSLNQIVDAFNDWKKCRRNL